MIFLHRFAPVFFVAVHRITEAAEGEKISSKADSISLMVSKLKRTPLPKLRLFMRMAVFSFEIVLICY